MKKIKIILSFVLSVTLILTTLSTLSYAKKTSNSNRKVKKKPPVAYNLNIKGTLEVGQTLTGTYTYSDANNDPEGQTLYRWMVSSTIDGTYEAISGINAHTYTLTDNEMGKYIKFEVTPISTQYPYTGSVAISSAVGPILESPPEPQPDPQPEPNPDPTPEPQPEPIPVPEPEPQPEPSKIVLGFATKYYSSDVSSFNSMVENKDSLDQIATVTYTADAYGDLNALIPNDQLDFAKQNDIITLALVGNNFDSEIASSILRVEIYKQNFIDNLVNEIKNNGYSGVNLDFEGMSFADRPYYNELIKDLKNTLSPLGYLLQVSVPAKTYDSTTNAWSGTFDYKAIGEYADQVLLMTYDEHGTWSQPGAVASIGWVTDVVNYAKSVIPQEKLLLGLAAYGYDWSNAGNKALSIKQINNIISQYNVPVQWDSESQTPYLNYTDSNGVYHTIWYENSYSIAFKLNLVNNENLLGVGIWRLGLEDTAYWDKINSKLSK